MSGSVDVGSIEPDDLENVCVGVEIMAQSHSSAEIWLLPVSEPFFSISGYFQSTWSIFCGSTNSLVFDRTVIRIKTMLLFSAYREFHLIPFFPLGKGFPWFSACSRWTAAMRDTPKNYILDALSNSENRMKKFLSVPEIVGGARGAPPP